MQRIQGILLITLLMLSVTPGILPASTYSGQILDHNRDELGGIEVEAAISGSSTTTTSTADGYFAFYFGDDGIRWRIKPIESGYRSFPSQVYFTEGSSQSPVTTRFLVAPDDMRMVRFYVTTSDPDVDPYFTAFFGFGVRTRCGDYGNWPDFRDWAAVAIPTDFHGEIRPYKEGLHVSPPILEVDGGSDEPTYSFTAVEGCRIQGYATVNGDGVTGVEDASILVDGVRVGATQPMENGFNYWLTVPKGWSGTLALESPIQGMTFDPPVMEFTNVTQDLGGRDFSLVDAPEITIAGSTLAEDGRPAEGVELVVDGEVVAVSNSQGGFEFTVSNGWSGTVTPRKSLHTFEPASWNFSNQTESFLATNFVHPLGFPVPVEFDYFSMRDHVGDGNGVKYWARCPQCPLPTHTVIEMDFADAGMSTPFDDMLRVIYEYEAADGYLDARQASQLDPVEAANGYSTRFRLETPPDDVPETCMSILIKFQYKFGVPGHYTYRTFHEIHSGFSTYDLVNSGDSVGIINIADLQALSAAIGSCSGHNCADFVTDPDSEERCVELADVGSFAGHYGHAAPGKAAPAGSLADAHRIKIVPGSDRGRACADLYLNAPQTKNWTLGAVRFAIGNLGAGAGADWQPAAPFEGNSMLVADHHAEPGIFNLVLINNDHAEADELYLGRIVAPTASGTGSSAVLDIAVALAEFTAEDATGDDSTKSDDPDTMIGGLAIQLDGSNPVRDTVSFSVRLPDAGALTAEVYDLRGRKVRTVVRSLNTNGVAALSWDGRDDRGCQLANGMYVLRVSAGAQQSTKKLVLLR